MLLEKNVNHGIGHGVFHFCLVVRIANGPESLICIPAENYIKTLIFLLIKQDNDNTLVPEYSRIHSFPFFLGRSKQLFVFKQWIRSRQILSIEI